MLRPEHQHDRDCRDLRVDVPPGTGIMMVWITNASAVSDPTTGSDSAAARPKWRRAAWSQSGAETA